METKASAIRTGPRMNHLVSVHYSDTNMQRYECSNYEFLGASIMLIDVKKIGHNIIIPIHLLSAPITILPYPRSN